MTILNSGQLKQLYFKKAIDYHKRARSECDCDECNLFDTITDRDEKIKVLEAKVEELEEEKYNRKIEDLAAGSSTDDPEHDPDCNALKPQPKGVYVHKACTCGAAKEPEVVLEVVRCLFWGCGGKPRTTKHKYCKDHFASEEEV